MIKLAKCCQTCKYATFGPKKPEAKCRLWSKKVTENILVNRVTYCDFYEAKNSIPFRTVWLKKLNYYNFLLGRKQQ